MAGELPHLAGELPHMAGELPHMVCELPHLGGLCQSMQVLLQSKGLFVPWQYLSLRTRGCQQQSSYH